MPIGMEFLTSADRRHLCGRENTIAELLASITKNSITLLLGNSGAGKTSVVHAGVFPVAFMEGWLPVYTRRSQRTHAGPLNADTSGYPFRAGGEGVLMF